MQAAVLIKLPHNKYMASGPVAEVLIDGVLHYVNENQIYALWIGDPHESS